MKILIVDDHVLFREGLVGIFAAHPEFEVVGEAGTVQEAVEIAHQLEPGMILMDWELPDGNGADASKLILTKLPDCKIVFLTIYETDEKLFSAIRSGAKGYMIKNVSSAKLVRTLLDVEAGLPALSNEMTARLMKEFSQSSVKEELPGNFLEALSPRELDVLKELVKGASNREIADTLFISENTVKHHVHNILEKLNVENRRQAAQYAKRNGL